MTPDEHMERLEAELLERTRKEENVSPKYSQEIILRYRELKTSGGFDRTIEERIPIEPDWDELTLSPCGHKTRILIMPINSVYVKGTTHQCPRCEKAWLAQALEDDKRREP